MRIVSADAVRLRIPFSDGGRGEGMTPSTWNHFDMVLVRLETDTGLVGWGEAFAYFCADAVAAMLNETVFPLVVGRAFAEPSEITELLQRRLVLFGRYGITLFAISGVDIALWDLKGKAEDRSIAELLGGRRRQNLPAYASLVRYGEAETAARFTRRAVSEGYGYVKLHEITRPEIEACARELGGAALMVDVNCSWPEDEARAMAAWLGEIGTMWLEEPTFPPEDFDQLTRLGSPIALSCGENLCTAWQFRDLVASGSVRYPQPSVTKVGGFTEVAKIMALAAGRDGVQIMPHSPYIGPGYLATLQICGALETEPLFEHLYVWPDAYLYEEMPLPRGGTVHVPEGPGLGLDPSPAVIERYRR
ncbi:mandelate racemase/muconate lactonizing enzyme family protein [Aureimonas flava]|nr:mandelate racemase/muconate lactonizing enzyme family protein [Aureimonas flava]